MRTTYTAAEVAKMRQRHAAEIAKRDNKIKELQAAIEKLVQIVEKSKELREKSRKNLKKLQDDVVTLKHVVIDARECLCLPVYDMNPYKNQQDVMKDFHITCANEFQRLYPKNSNSLGD